jgi:hypothetical protein
MDMKLEVAKDEKIAQGIEGRKIAVTISTHVMLSSLISTSMCSRTVASSSERVAKRSHKKKRQMLLQLDEEEVVELCPMMQQEQTVDPSDMGGL